MPSPTTPPDADTLRQQEALTWQNGFDLEQWQQLVKQYQHQQAALTSSQREQQHHFVLVIPIADRPQHLQSCLQSLLKLCQTYQYGGVKNNRYKKIAVLIADDSQQQNNIEQQQQIAKHFSQQGLSCHYFGQQQQLELLNQLSPEKLEKIEAIIGKINPKKFYHKGASITRNIAYLKLQRDYADKKNHLFYFIDSDQEFQLAIQTPKGEQKLCAINFFYHLDQIFHDQKIKILTGKVVGDPPVSPAVMANTLLTDLQQLLLTLSTQPATAACPLHQKGQAKGEAHYHDMADLFGISTPTEQPPIQCAINHAHNQADTFKHVANRLNHFFDGAHPTRSSHFDYSPFGQLTPARTVYSGNYIFKAEALEFFLPFAKLKLRMAGPTLGRLIQSKLADGFVSANLPMLHKRTVQSEGRAEFRPGVDHQTKTIDLSVEFERQFYGDVMLFSIIKLSQIAYPEQELAHAKIEQFTQETELDLRKKYQQKQQQTLENLAQLSDLFASPEQWWHQQVGLKVSCDNFHRFLHNLQHNFSLEAQGYQLINSDSHRQSRLTEIQQAISELKTDQQAWQKTLNHFAQARD